MTRTGKLIVIDGIDGSGKRTQAELLQKVLIANGIKTELFDFPRYGEKSAALVEEYLCGNFGTADEVGPYRASIFYAVDRYAASKKMKELLEQGVFIISNRYVSASKGHQAARIDGKSERERFLGWLNNLEYTVFGIPKPDLTLFLHVPSSIGYELVLKKDKRGYIRGKKQDILEEDRGHLEQAENTYLEMASGLDTTENWKTVECSEGGQMLSVAEISERIINLINREFDMTIKKSAYTTRLPARPEGRSGGRTDKDVR